MVKRLVRSLVPEPLLSVYHYLLAALAAALYRHPSSELVVIGVTGTNGKSTTTQFIGQLLESAGYRVGWTTTVGFKVADREWVNDKKMTMLGRFQTQKLLRDMVRAGCRYAVVETSSQGIAQFRHTGINYDVVAFTNLTPEHIEAHGGFESYKRAKGKLFAHTGSSRRKTLNGQLVQKTTVANIDDPHAGYFLGFPMDKKYGYGIKGSSKAITVPALIPVIAEDVALEASCSTFVINPTPNPQNPTPSFHLNVPGLFNVYNALAAITVCRALDVSWESVRAGVAKLTSVPGRLERIDGGQPFSVIVDYAYEPAALEAVYAALSLHRVKRIIHVTGSAGGGRDVARRETLGRMAAEHDAIVIVTNEDPYDDDPWEIINDVADAVVQAGKKENVDVFRVLDRQEAIDRAIALAEDEDLVLITGKGSEPVMAVADGKKIPWDDRDAARRALAARGYAR